MKDISFNPFASHPEAEHIKVYGEEVVLVSPMFIQLAIKVPWSLNSRVTFEQQKFVAAKAEKVVAWLIEQGMIPSASIGIAIMTNHNP